MEYVNEERLRETLAGAPASYRDAEPFPHAVIDSLLRPEVAAALEAQFPKVDHRMWKHHLHLNSHKFACNRPEAMPELFRAVIDELNSKPVLEYLERLTGISGLVADGELEGGGLHQITRGGYLKVHADFNYHPGTGFHRRLNLLLYLNRGWDEGWDGNLELWDRAMARCVKSIAPVLNRCVIFSTTDFANHGHPRPLSCPGETTRKSIALYYYTVTRPAEELGRSHSTLYKRRPTDSVFAQACAFATHLVTDIWERIF
jgi:hypothetical protein